MRPFLFLSSTLLVGCGQVPNATPTSEARYLSCVQEHGKAFGTRDNVTKAQAIQAAKPCESLLRSASVELQNERAKNIDVSKLNSRGRAMLTRDYIEAHLENYALRQISADVLPLPEV